MRSGKSLLVLIVLALGLGAYIYFVEMKRDPAPADTTAAKTKVFTIEPGKIEEIELRSATGEVTRAKKTANDWQILAPTASAADPVEVSTVSSAIEALESGRVIDENPAAVSDFGLDPARIEVKFRVAGETAMKRLLLGTKTPTGGDMYARVDGQPKVFLVASYLENTFNRTPFDLREKTVLTFSRDSVDALRLESPKSTIALARKAGEWRLTAPVDTRADAGALDGLIGRLFQAKMTSIAAEDGSAELKKYGLDKPQTTVVLGAGSAQSSLAIGAAKDDTAVYARDTSRPMVFTIEKAVADELKKTPDDLRLKDLFEFRSFTATGLDVVIGGQTFTFTQQKGATDGASPVWKLTAPKAGDVDQTKVTDALTAISNLRAESFVAKPAASGETVIITARFGDAASPKTEQVTFRKSGTVVHAIRQGEAGAAVVSTTDFDRAVTLLKELTKS